jgi:hypothetical protein
VMSIKPCSIRPHFYVVVVIAETDERFLRPNGQTYRYIRSHHSKQTKKKVAETKLVVQFTLLSLQFGRRCL